MVQRLEMRTALHEAIEAEQFVLQYQPIVDLHTGLVTGVESLVRWQHPTRGLLGPYHFIELAEESGAIVGHRRLGAARGAAPVRRVARRRPGHPLRYVSVNVSARQFRTPGFVDQVRRALPDAGARPEWLLLEITESLVLRDAEQVWADLRALRAMGVRIAIDDFGTGYSSLSYLRQMPVDVLKIDKSFIDDILHQRAAARPGRRDRHAGPQPRPRGGRRGHRGRRPARRAGRMGCPYGQGYLFSKPVWPADVIELTRSIPELVAATPEPASRK